MAQQQGGGDDSGSMFMMLIIGVIAIWAIGHFFGATLVRWYFVVKRVELMAMWPIVGHFDSAQLAWKFMGETSPKAVTLVQVKEVGKIVGRFLDVPIVALLAFLTWRAWKTNPGSKFNQRYSMKSLAQSQQALWSCIAPVAGLDIIGQDLHKGPWAMSPRPLDFAKKYRLIDQDKKLDLDRSEKLFASQLGRLWEGPKRLSPPIRALFAVYAAFGSGEKKAAEEAIDKLNYSYAAGKPDFSWVDAMLEKHAKNPEVVHITQSHAYVTTVMASLLEWSRKMGPLPSSTFIWLKPVNRQMWYVLNGVGRAVAFAEIAGFYGHWVAEKVAKKPLERPYVKNAVDGLQRHFENEIRIE